MRRQAASTASTRLRPATEFDRRAASGRLQNALLAGRNTDGGWGYYTGKASRLEPTCWALLAFGSGADEPLRETAAGWLARCQQPSGWLLEDPQWPVNIAFNGLASFAMHAKAQPQLDSVRRRLLERLTASKGLTAPQTDAQRQDNSLQGWSWVDATFSWVEPTCWGLLALKKAAAGGISDAAMKARIAEAERLLIDRGCQPGGWNFGNASVMGQDLRPYVPTTALGLLAMQDRRDHGVVTRGLAALEALWDDEISASALALSCLALDVYERPTGQVLTRIVNHVDDALAFGNQCGMALSLFALSSAGSNHAFRL